MEGLSKILIGVVVVLVIAIIVILAVTFGTKLNCEKCNDCPDCPECPPPPKCPDPVKAPCEKIELYYLDRVTAPLDVFNSEVIPIIRALLGLSINERDPMVLLPIVLVRKAENPKQAYIVDNNNEIIAITDSNGKKTVVVDQHTDNPITINIATDEPDVINVDVNLNGPVSQLTFRKFNPGSILI